MNNLLTVGVKIGKREISSAIINVDDSVVLSRSSSSVAMNAVGSADDILTSCAMVIKKSLKAYPNNDFKVGLALSAQFESAHTITPFCNNQSFKTLPKLNVKMMLAEKLGIAEIDVFIVNEAEAFLRGEVYNGASPDYRYKKVIGLSMGGGLLSATYDSEKFQNSNFWGSPFLQGIAENYFTTSWFIKRYFEITGERIDGVSKISSFNKVTLASKQLYSEFSANLALFLDRLAVVHKPDAIILGGSVSNAFQTFFPELRRCLNKRQNFTPVYKAKLREKAALFGAANCYNTESKVLSMDF
jgi:glucokinase